MKSNMRVKLNPFSIDQSSLRAADFCAIKTIISFLHLYCAHSHSSAGIGQKNRRNLCINGKVLGKVATQTGATPQLHLPEMQSPLAKPDVAAAPRW